VDDCECVEEGVNEVYY